MIGVFLLFNYWEFCGKIIKGREGVDVAESLRVGVIAAGNV